MASKPKNVVDKRITPAFMAQAGKGRPKGVQNKTTITIREAILAAFDKAGGANYLARMADEQPVAFLALLSKVLPTQINLGTKADGIKIVIERAAPANGDDAKVIDIKPNA
jgi:hypothetical protein